MQRHGLGNGPTTFRTSTFCSADGCIAVGTAPGNVVQMRDTKVSDSETLTFTEGEWLAFIADIKAGRL